MKHNGIRMSEQVTDAGHGSLRKTSDIDAACKRRLDERWGIKTYNYVVRNKMNHQRVLDDAEKGIFPVVNPKGRGHKNR